MSRTTKVYVLDNGKSYSSHFIMFVEAVSSDFEPLWALYEKAWPRMRDSRESVFALVAIAPAFDWRVGKAATINDWLEELELSLSEFVADVEAANDFVLMARRWWPGFDSFRAFPFEAYPPKGSIPTC